MLDYLEDEAYRAGLEMDTNSLSKELIFRPRENKDMLPTVYATYDEDNEQFWYYTRLVFPNPIRHGDLGGHFKYMWDRLRPIMKFADWLGEHSFYFLDEDDR